MKGLKLGQKILIIGSPGSGKSTLGKKLSSITKYPLYHLDIIWWRPNWTHINDEDFLCDLQKIMKNEKWIIEGHYARNLEYRLKEADTVIFLDYKRIVCVNRVIKRVWKYRKTERDDISKGCQDKFSFAFLKWTWGYPKREKPHVHGLMRKYDNINWIVFKNSHELNKYLKMINTNTFVDISKSRI